MLQIQIINFLAKPNTDKDAFLQIIIPPVAYEVESLNIEMKMNITDEEHFIEAYYPFTVEPEFSTLSIIDEISKQKPFFSFLPNDCIRNLLGFNAGTLYEENNPSPNPVDILSYDRTF